MNLFQINVKIGCKLAEFNEELLDTSIYDYLKNKNDIYIMLTIATICIIVIKVINNFSPQSAKDELYKSITRIIVNFHRVFFLIFFKSKMISIHKYINNIDFNNVRQYY